VSFCINLLLIYLSFRNFAIFAGKFFRYPRRVRRCMIRYCNEWAWTQHGGLGCFIALFGLARRRLAW